MDILSYAIGKKAGGGSPTPPTPPSLTDLTATENGTYNHSGFDGYDEVVVAVPAVEPDLVDLEVSANGTYTHSGHDGYDEVSVNVPNSYGASDEGKVVSSAALVSQTSTTKTQNGTYDTTTNNEVVINVPNTYTAADEGKAVFNGQLWEQMATTKTENGTYDTTYINSVTVDVQGTTPTGNINITNMNSTDVSAYATAQVVDSDLVASNIKKDVNILGVTGTYEGSGGGGGGTPEKGLVITEPTPENYVFDVYGYCLDEMKPTPGKTPGASLYQHDKYHHGNSTQSLTVNVHSNEVTKLPTSWMYQYETSEYPITVNLPNSIASFEDSTFRNCKGLTSITWPTSLSSISSRCFLNTSISGDIVLPSTMRTIASKAFYSNLGITSLKMIRPAGYTVSMTSDSLYGCTNITDIYVSWPEGEVMGAPWGATNATIHYNCTE